MEDRNPFQQMLDKDYLDYCSKQGKRRVSDNEYARHLGVSPASFNQWINGNRLPDIENAARLAKTLGPEVFEVLGYNEVTYVDDPKLKVVTRSWRVLTEEEKDEVAEFVKSTTKGRKLIPK